MRIRKLLGVFIFVLAYLYKLRFIKASSWTYEDQSGWQAAGFEQCSATGLRQSPINIVTKDASSNLDYKLEFIDYDKPIKYLYNNTLHSVSLLPFTSLVKPRVIPSWMPGRVEYLLNEIHFHWGATGGELRSEHKIDGADHQAEMHLVHVKNGLSKADIATNDDSLLVIGVFIEAATGGQQVDPDLEAAARETSRVSGSNQTYSSESRWAPLSFLPKARDKFYSYLGSLTTPPCLEVVNWVVMRDVALLSTDIISKLTAFEAMHAGHSEPELIGPNCRQVMPLQGRSVVASFNQADNNINNNNNNNNNNNSSNNPLVQLLSGLFSRVLPVELNGFKKFFPLVVQSQGSTVT